MPLRIAAVAPLLLLLSLPASAQGSVPAPLTPWVPWVLEGQEALRCPLVPGAATDDRRLASGQCAWATSLELILDEDGGTFRQGWRVFQSAEIQLPGDARHFPQEVMLDGRPAPARLAGGEVRLSLTEGVHTISGRFLWDALPESLRVPAATGLLSLKVRGRAVPQPHREPGGTLYLQQAKQDEAPQQDALELRVYRRISDEVPLQVHTTIELEVSGRNRELLLGRALLPGGLPVELSGSLPARLESDGRVRVQVRPGTWTLSLLERHEGPVTSLTRPEPGGPWVEGEEVWVYDARPQLRVATVEDVPAIDAAQTTLPPELRAFPAFAVAKGATFTLEVARRGDQDPAPDRLQLTRHLWLDFDGKGLTARDELVGALSRSWRLTAAPATELGRVSVGDVPQFITRVSADEAPGVEIRQGQVQVSADSRLAFAGGRLPAVGWAHDVQSLQTTLHLPPGWTLLHASGADRVSTWVSRWTLLDVFLLVIIAFAAGRLHGWRWGALALVTVGLSYHESGAPRLTWLALLATDALLRVLPKGTFGNVVRWTRYATIGLLVLFFINYAVDQVRRGLYPVLEQPYAELGKETRFRTGPGRGDIAPLFVKEEMARAAPGESAEAMDEEYGSEGSAYGSASSAPTRMLRSSLKKTFDAQSYDKDTVMQTGPGLPRWDWNPVSLVYSGPVQQSQELSLWLVPPWANRLLAFLRVALIGLLALLLMGVGQARWPRFLRPRSVAPAAAAALLVALGLLGPSTASANELPSAEVLEQLRQRLLQRPACHPDCATLPRMQLEITPDALRARLRVHADADTGVTLPGSGNGWQAERVLLNGTPATALLRTEGGQLVLWVPKGVHEVILEGGLPSRTTVGLGLPLRPLRVEAQVKGWTVDGLFEDGRVNGDLQLTREARTTVNDTGGSEEALQPSTLPPFLQVERSLSLGLNWTVETVVRRLSPTGSAVVLTVPLLPGEAVVTQDVRVEDGKVRLNLPANATELRWNSRLTMAPKLALTAPKDVSWSEVWRVETGPTWHLEASGLPPIHPPEGQAVRIPEFRPWPGEVLSLALTRPQGVAGQTVTIDRSHLQMQPGQRVTQATLSLVLRASRGGPHTLTLPEGAQLERVTLGGVSQPVRQDGRAITLPLVPGAQDAELAWLQPTGISGVFTTPELDLGLPSVNATVSVEVPRDRWVLFARGPSVGPAILFWGVFLVLLLIAGGLSRIPLTPLRAFEWLLLCVGLSQVPIILAAMVPGWLLALGWRKQNPEWPSVLFNLRQLFLLGLGLLAMGVLVGAIHSGLLSTPDMQIEGNGSSAYSLRWFQDRVAGTLPATTVISAPLLVFRFVMLAWALWIAGSLLKWLRWGWSAFSEGGLWLSTPPPVRIATATVPPPPPAPPPAAPPPAG